MRTGAGWGVLMAVLLLALSIGCGDNEMTDAPGGGTSQGGAGATGGGGSSTCCGCLCGDPAWSCSQETCFDDSGVAIALVNEAGFIELAGADASSEYTTAIHRPRARVWYTFQPADEDPESKPLVIFMNGVGGAALALTAFNTGRYTYDPRYTDGELIAENAFRWTSFANIMYIDQPGAGYSYHLPRADGSTPTYQWDAFADGADYLRFLFRFLARHPQLADSRIVLAGESGGGLKSVSILHSMLEYPTLLEGGRYTDPELYDEIVAFLGTKRADIEPTDWTSEDIAELFRLVLIQPYLVREQLPNLLDPDDVEGCIPDDNDDNEQDDADILQCDVTAAEEEMVKASVGEAVTDPVIHSQFTGVDLTGIEWLHAESRTGAYPRSSDLFQFPEDQSKLIEAFGEPEEGDVYFIFQRFSPAFYPDMAANEGHARTALRVLHAIPTFFTRGRYDLTFNPIFLAPSFALYTDLLVSATNDFEAPASAERPGQMVFVYQDDAFGGGTRTFPLPEYLAGHAVTHGAPGEFVEDVQLFLEATAR